MGNTASVVIYFLEEETHLELLYPNVTFQVWFAHRA